MTHPAAAMPRMALVALLAAGFGLAGCDGNGRFSKQDFGTLLGGIGGAVVGAQFGKGTGQLVGVAAGALAGAWLGNQLGASLDKADQAAMQDANQKAATAPIGQTVSWRNPDSGNSGTVTPTREVKAAGGDYCREFQQTVTVGGKSEEAYGTACRQPDGSWKVVG